MARNISSHTKPAKRECIKNNITVVLMAGSPGIRMKTYGPPCLQRLGSGCTLLEHQINVIKEYIPNSEIIITCRYESDKIIRSKPDHVRVVESQIEDTNETEEIRLALNNIVTDCVLFISSDTYFDKNVIKGLDFSRSFVIYENKGMMKQDSVGMTIVNGKTTIMSYSLDNKWGKIFNVNNASKKRLNQFCRQDGNTKMYAHEALNYVVDKNPVYAYECKGILYSVERVDDLKGLEKI